MKRKDKILNEILEVLNAINDETLLERMCFFIKRFAKNWGN